MIYLLLLLLFLAGGGGEEKRKQTNIYYHYMCINWLCLFCWMVLKVACDQIIRSLDVYHNRFLNLMLVFYFSESCIRMYWSVLVHRKRVSTGLFWTEKKSSLPLTVSISVWFPSVTAVAMFCGYNNRVTLCSSFCGVWSGPEHVLFIAKMSAFSLLAFQLQTHKGLKGRLFIMTQTHNMQTQVSE